MTLKLYFENKEEELTVLMDGDLDIYSSPDFSKEVQENYSKASKNIVFDASKLNYIDSTGLGAFISLYKNVNEDGNKIKITGIKNNVAKIFKITELDKLFEIEA